MQEGPDIRFGGRNEITQFGKRIDGRSNKADCLLDSFAEGRERGQELLAVVAEVDFHPLQQATERLQEGANIRFSRCNEIRELAQGIDPGGDQANDFADAFGECTRCCNALRVELRHPSEEGLHQLSEVLHEQVDVIGVRCAELIELIQRRDSGADNANHLAEGVREQRCGRQRIGLERRRGCYKDPNELGQVLHKQLEIVLIRRAEPIKRRQGIDAGFDYSHDFAGGLGQGDSSRQARPTQPRASLDETRDQPRDFARKRLNNPIDRLDVGVERGEGCDPDRDNSQYLAGSVRKGNRASQSRAAQPRARLNKLENEPVQFARERGHLAVDRLDVGVERGEGFHPD